MPSMERDLKVSEIVQVQLMERRRSLFSKTASKRCLGISGYTENNLQPRQPKFAAFEAEILACR